MKSLKQYVKDKQNPYKKVVMFIGRFQPITKAHAEIINDMIKEYDSYVPFVFVVKGKKTSLDKSVNPLDSDDQIRMIKQSVNNDKLKHIHVVPSAYIGDLAELIRHERMEPAVLICGTDRVKMYEAMIEDCKDEYKINIDVKEIERDDSDISASKVRLAVVDDDYETFKDLTTNLTKDDFDLLKEKIQAGSSK